MSLSVEASADWESAAQLRAEMAREMDRDWDAESPGWRERYRAYFEARARRGDAQLYLAREDGELAGMAIVSQAEHYRTAAFGTAFAYVNGVFVRRIFRRKGVASALMRAVQTWASERHCAAIRLRASETGVLLYRSLGFTPTNEMELRLGS